MQANEPPKLPKTVRVLKPPGGGSSICFDGGNEDYTMYRKAGAPMKSAVTNGIHKEVQKTTTEEPKTPSEVPAEVPAETTESPKKEAEASPAPSSPPAETAEASPEAEKVEEIKQNGAGKDEKITECMAVDTCVVNESVSSTEVSEVTSKDVSEVTSSEVLEVVSNGLSKISISDTAPVAEDVSVPNVASPMPQDTVDFSFPVPSEFAQKEECTSSATPPSSPDAHPIQPTPDPDVHPVASTPEARPNQPIPDAQPIRSTRNSPLPPTPVTPDPKPIVDCPLTEKPVVAPARTPQPQPKRIPDHMRSSIFSPSSYDYQHDYRSREPPKPAPAPAPVQPVEAPQRKRIPPGGFSSKLW